MTATQKSLQAVKNSRWSPPFLCCTKTIKDVKAEWCCLNRPWVLIHIGSTHTQQPSPDPAATRFRRDPWETGFNKDGWRTVSFKLGALSPDIIGSWLNEEVAAPRLLPPNRRCCLADSGPLITRSARHRERTNSPERVHRTGSPGRSETQELRQRINTSVCERRSQRQHLSLSFVRIPTHL